MPIATANGVALHFQRLGEGPEVVLLHGLTANLAFWHPAIVSGLAAEHTLTLVDLRGHGRSDMPRSGYTTRDHAQDVAGLLEHLGVARAAVLGHSYGGAVALHLAALAPERVTALVLADARVRALQPAHGIDVWEQWPRIRERLREQGIAIEPADVAREFGLLEALARLRLAGRLDGVDLRPFFVPFASGSRRVAERWLRLVEHTTAIQEFQQLAGLSPEAIRAIAHPTLLVFGGLSHCRPTEAGLMRLLPDVRSVPVPGVGHFHPLLVPDALLDAARPFLRAAARPAGGAPRTAGAAGACH